jgi:PleD family two-component response regulator
MGTAREWIEQADAALYGAKLAGRNRFVVAA